VNVEIAGRVIGAGGPFVIAEGGVNHNGSLELALRLVDAAADAGGDAVKFQTFSAEAVVLPSARQAEYQRQRAAAESQLEMVRRLELPAAAWATLRDRARERGLVFLSTPFDLASVDLLARLDVPAFKVGSGDLTNLVLLRAVAGHGRPLLLSTGMATLDEVAAAVADLRAHGDPPLILLQCTSAYPADAEEANLGAMATLREAFGVPVGYSDHTLGTSVAIAAAAMGAAVIEKHLTLDRGMPGPDHAASLEPGDFAAMVSGVREAAAAVGDGIKAPRPGEADAAAVARRSLVVIRRVAAGEELRADDLDAMRPAGGISPLRLDEVIGRRAARELGERTIIGPDDLEPPL
jgi:N-acetylneuraminate synthase/N,N'-diacetyllegionaminate synthase